MKLFINSYLKKNINYLTLLLVNNVKNKIKDKGTWCTTHLHPIIYFIL